jgi:hypothetical protein
MSGVMRIMIFHIVLCFLFALPAGAAKQAVPQDSTTSNSSKKRKSNLKLTARISSVGFFNFSGRICNDNPAFDVALQYDRKAFGISVFNTTDLYDTHSSNNFVFGLIYKKFRIGDGITVTPYSGFIVAEWGKEKGDRQVIITSVRLNPKFAVDHTLLLSNVTRREFMDCVNRLRLVFLMDRHLNFTWSLWHNNRFFDRYDYLSSGFNAAYNHVKITDHLALSTGITLLVMANTSNEEIFPKKNGIVFTIAATID